MQMDVKIMHDGICVGAYGVDREIIGSCRGSTHGDRERRTCRPHRERASVASGRDRTPRRYALDRDIIVVPTSAVDGARYHRTRKIEADYVVAWNGKEVVRRRRTQQRRRPHATS